MNNILKAKNLKALIGIILIYVIVQALIMVGIVDDYYQILLVMICLNIILSVSLNLITGFTGQFSLGHAGFMAIGAYVCGYITVTVEQEFSFLIGIFAGAIAAALVGILIGIPTLRLKGDYLAIATLGMAEIIRIIILNVEAVGGASGLSIPQYANWTWVYIFTVATIVLIKNFINSTHGRACISIREDEIASEAMGINTTRYKVIAFAIGAFFAGVAGALYSLYFYFIKPDQFGFMKSIDILVIVVLGGLGNIHGSIIASILLATISSYLQEYPELKMVIYALVLIVIMILKNKDMTKFKKFITEKILRRQTAV
ncbi:branched-chain amino acid ABC transporter permease [Clostridium thermosuccinogenes]|uniref:Branched-chain amino acid ABC transporter permease n=1 Tax=Clostridium thermosuccinogenes TaxID=84032 RepID=A0A2K2FFB4_9CLOT|nr:branched-chain amino acid ABC transporter permease [Pseudoclostridium thermosuccinogenes]AUS97600.1 branched-chain amino acid ABC transporter permease [Pseudoclostridium thermosuccinogenes]PNT97464.1 branched-chain amino acid ABC transporter permease [Pseudoclostridium thermosuccinogenes]PNT99496.1 branched-chain amino acid ABC transporter permease [Pseudoclostridium thermosuccinogenes]